MLQWMGGSRKKVATSRKSTYKRQKQYFEQRRRQQHNQVAGLENYDERARLFGQNHQEHRSLDILNMANLSTVSQDWKPAFTNGTLSSHQAETGLPKNPPTYHSRGIDGVDKNLDLSNTAALQQLSVFDLLGEDGVNGDSERFLVSEPHVAFSVEGLGKVGAETPVQSPQPAHGCSPLKAARRLNTSRSLGYVLDDIGFEVDPLMEEIGAPSDSTLEFSTGIKDLFSKPKMNLSTFQDHMQLDGHNAEIRGSPSDRRTFCNTGHSDDMWEARSCILDVHMFDEMDSDIFWKSWPCQMDDISSDLLKYENDEVPDYGFQSPHRPYKREASRATEQFSFLDSPAPKNQISGDGHDFIVFRGARHHSAGTSFSFGDVIDQADRACYMTEAERDNLCSTCEESCSSAAVRHLPTEGCLPDITAKRYSRRYQNSFGSPEGDKNFAQEKHSRTRSKILEQNNEWGSRKSKWLPNLSESKSACKPNSSGAWLYEGGCSSAHINSAETEHPSLGPRHWNEDRFSVIPVPDPFIDAEFSTSISEQGSAVKFPPSVSFICGECALCPPSGDKHSHGSPEVSNFDFGLSKQECYPDFPNFKLEDGPLISSHDAGSCTEPFIPDLLARQSLSKLEENKSKLHQDNRGKVETRKELVDNMMTISASDTGENAPGYKEEKDRTSETSSSVKIPDRPQTNVEEKEYDC